MHSLAFYAYNANNYVHESLTQSGQHIHIGVNPCEMHRLPYEVKELLALHARKIYPLLIAISAQPIPSERMLNSQYCAPLYDNDNCMPTEEDNHSQELNYSHIGTLEFRAFDTNIPQCSLTEAWILTKLCNHIRHKPLIDYEQHTDIIGFSKTQYKTLRNLACLHGFASLPITEMLLKIYDMLHEENLDNFECDSIRDVLYLMAKYSLNPSDIYHIIKPNKFDYFRKMFESPHLYLANLAEITEQVNSKTLLNKFLHESRKISTFEQLIKLSQEQTTNDFKAKIKQTRFPIPLIDTNIIKQKLQMKDFQIKRISAFQEYAFEEIATKISEMMQKDTSNFINKMNTHEIISANERFYALSMEINNKTEILGSVAIRMATGEISHLIVDSNYRNLGIGSALIDYVVNFAIETAFQKVLTFVREGNEISQTMFLKHGFKLNNATNEDKETGSNRLEFNIECSQVN